MKDSILYQVDAFTKERYKGNPAGIMFLEKEMDRTKMQQISKEMNLSETAFIDLSQKTPRIRFFTPTKEINLCGHATLSTGHLMYELGMVPKGESITLQSNVGELYLREVGDLVEMDLPIFPYKTIPEPKELYASIGVKASQVYTSNGWIIAEIDDVDALKEIVPNYHQMVTSGLDSIIVTAPGGDSVDFSLRVFVPGSGIDEDPVTGSAQCSVMPIWTKKLNKKRLKSYQASARGGYLDSEIKNDRVLVRGHAKTIFKLEML